MASRFAYISERLVDYRSRLKLGERKTQLALASGATAIALIVVAVLVLPGSETGSGPAGAGQREAGSISELAEQAAAEGVTIPGGSRSPRRGGSGAGESAGAVVPGGPGEPPVSDTEIKVGIAYISDPGTTNAAAGFQGIGQVDQKRAWDAMLEEVNKVAPGGRKLVPVWFPMSENDIISKGAERIAQEQCAHWTQDNKVFLVWGAGSDLLPCLTKAGVAAIGGGGGLSWSKTYEENPYLISPNSAALDRMAAFHVDRLHGAGFFDRFKENDLPYTPGIPPDRKPRIGLIRYDQPSYDAGAKAVKQRLAAHGLALCDGCEWVVSYSSDNPQEQLDDATEVNQAIQSFKSDGVTHVIFLGSTAGGRITLFFVDGAEKQHYRPRLGLNPLDLPTLVRDFLGPASHPQFRMSVYTTWAPRDLGSEPEAYKTCRAIFEAAGETFGGDDDRARNKDAQIPLYCDTAWYTRSVLHSVGRTLTLEAFMNGVHTMAAVPSASTYLMQTKQGRHDGVGAVQMGEWVDDCACWKPTSDIIPV